MSRQFSPALSSTTAVAPSATTAAPSSLSGTSSTAGSLCGFQLSRLRCRIHPAVIMTMLDAHCRLRDSQNVAIGTLLGTVSSEGALKGPGMVIVEVADSFVNLYTEDIRIQKDQHEWMVKLREKINPKLQVVGWFSTSNDIHYATLVSEWVRLDPKVSRFTPSKLFSEPLQIVVDPTFSNELSILNQIKVYTRGPLRQLFHEVPFEMATSPADTLAISSIVKSSSVHRSPNEIRQPPVLQDSIENLETSLSRFQNLVAECLVYIEQVLSGEREGDSEIGRALMRTTCLDTLLPPDEVDAMCESSMQDNLMIAFLTNLARLQFAIAEKLNTSLT